MRRVALALVALGCSAPATLPYNDEVVVTAYLYAYRPVTGIEVTSTIPLTSADSVGTPVSDAEVTLTHRGARYPLSPTPGVAGFYGYAGTDLVVAIGDTFDLTVVRGSSVATATAVVPEPPDGIALSATQMTIDTSNGLPFDTIPFVVRWPNAAHDYFFTVVQPVDSAQVAIPGLGGGGQTAQGSVFSTPTQADSAVIPFTSIRYFGPQRLLLFRVPPEYAALYASRQQDSRDLNEPATNIHGGLGIFAAFAADSAFFTVTGGP